MKGIKQAVEFFLQKKHKHHCPLCYSTKKYLPLSNYYLDHWKKHGFELYNSAEMLSLDAYECAECGASDRERLYAYYLFNLIKKNKLTYQDNIIHFSPEKRLMEKLKQLNFTNYKTADYLSDDADLKLNIMNLDLKNNSVDFFICSHIIEHVEDDCQAIKELYRVTKSGGQGILMAPIVLSLQSTLENTGFLSEEERWRQFGQDDHMRLYAKDDYLHRIQKSGFKVKEFSKKEIGAPVFKKLGLSNTSILYIVNK